MRNADATAALVATSLALCAAALAPWPSAEATPLALALVLSAPMLALLSLPCRDQALAAAFPWSVAVALACVPALLLTGSGTARHLSLIPGVVVFGAVLELTARAFLRAGIAAHVAAAAAVGLFVVAASAPLWAGPWVLRPGVGTATASTIVASSPLVHLAGLIDYDVLRSDWFYRHSALGSVRFDYPHPALLHVACAVVVVAALTALMRARARRPDRALP